MRDYTQLTSEERYQIEALLKADHNQTEIASVLKRDKSTISREFGRNRGLRGYRPKQAQRLTDNRRESRVRPRIACGTWERVESLLREEWSPEQKALDPLPGSRACCARSGVRSRSAVSCRGSRGCV